MKETLLVTFDAHPLISLAPVAALVILLVAVSLRMIAGTPNALTVSGTWLATMALAISLATIAGTWANTHRALAIIQDPSAEILRAVTTQNGTEIIVGTRPPFQDKPVLGVTTPTQSSPKLTRIEPNLLDALTRRGYTLPNP